LFSCYHGGLYLFVASWVAHCEISLFQNPASHNSALYIPVGTMVLHDRKLKYFSDSHSPHPHLFSIPHLPPANAKNNIETRSRVTYSASRPTEWCF